MKSLTERPNIGKKLSMELGGIGIRTYRDLRESGSVAAYRFLSERSPSRLPVCYYLYSLEGAILNIKWTELTNEQKARLKREAGIDG